MPDTSPSVRPKAFGVDKARDTCSGGGAIDGGTTGAQRRSLSSLLKFKRRKTAMWIAPEPDPG